MDWLYTASGDPSPWVIYPLITVLVSGVVYYFIRPGLIAQRQRDLEEQALWDNAGQGEEVEQPRFVAHVRSYDLPTIITKRPDNREQRLLNVLLKSRLEPRMNAHAPQGYPSVSNRHITPPVYHEPSYWFGTANERPLKHTLDHARWACKTGGGKSHIIIRIVAQLLAQGVEVWYINPKYMPVDRGGIDFRPVIQRCHKVAIEIDGKDSLLLLEAARLEMYARIKRSRAEGTSVFSPMAVVIDELSTLDSAWKELERGESKRWHDAHNRGVSAIDRLIRWGRQPGVFYLATSQDAQIQNGPTNSGTAGNFGLSACRPNLDKWSRANIFGDRDQKTLPEITGEYEWWVVTNNATGQDEVVKVEVPPLTNEWIMETVGALIERNVEQQAVNDSSMNQSEPKLVELAESVLSEALVVPRSMDVPLPKAEQVFPPLIPEEETVPGGTPDGTDDGTVKIGKEDYIKATLLLTREPSISQRELAYQLWGKRDGRWNGRAGEVMAHIRRIQGQL